MPFLSRALSLNPGGLAAEDGERVWSYGDLSREAEGIARRLRTIGVEPGHVVSLAGRVDGSLLAALHGIWKAGGTVAPTNDRWTKDERTRALAVLKPRLFLAGEGRGGRSEAGPGLPGLEAFRLGASGEPSLPSLRDLDPSPGPLPGLPLDADAAHLLTSGTSGQPRVVRITVQNLLASAEGSRDRLDLRPSDRWLGSLSLSHVGGMALATRASVVGSALVLRGSFSVASFLVLLEDRAITHASLVPTMLHQALAAWGGEAVPDSLRCLLIGGAPAQEDLVRDALKAGFPIALTYGLTEASSQVATAPPALVEEKPGTVGAPLPGVIVRVSDSGELLVQGPTVAPGQAGTDGWLHTGDLARVDADGHLWITGRQSDRIISGGVNVDPAEVAKALESHPQVDEVEVVGVPDREWGERVVAVVVSRSPGTALRDELDQLARTALSSAKRPRAIRFLDSVPRNPNGKVDRKKLRDLFR
ncbi:MAG: class I adenylate-forming enzyme family protein [Gemmatimonadota bacterium]